MNNPIEPWTSVGGVAIEGSAGHLQDDMVVTRAATPTADCDGVTISTALPDGPAQSDSVADPIFNQNCQSEDGRFIKVDTSTASRKRASTHYRGSCFLGGNEAHL